MQRHIRDVRVERLPHPLADELDQGLELELRRERLPDAVDGRELGDALPRLVDQLGVLERDAQAAGDRREQPLVRLAERVLAVEVLDRQDAGGPPADEQRLEDC